MSAFDKDAQNQSEINTITENFLENLVGEGKKFPDTEALARGKHAADQHVDNLERQITELREDIDQGSKINELMELVRNQNKPQETNTPQNEGPGDTSSGQMTEEELKVLIETHVSERDRQSTEASNVAEADRVLAEKFGDSAGRILNERAASLGMAVEEMKALAAKNPKVFSRLMGMDGDNRPRESSSLLGSNQRSEGVQIKGANTRDSAYYEKLRKENKSLYYKPKTQMQLMKDAEALGEAFYINNS